MDVKVNETKMHEFIKAFLIVNEISYEKAFMMLLHHIENYNLEAFICDLYNKTIEREDNV